MGKTLSLPVRIKVSDERHIKADTSAALRMTFADQFDNKDFTVTAVHASHVYFVCAKVKGGRLPHAGVILENSFSLSDAESGANASPKFVLCHALAAAGSDRAKLDLYFTDSVSSCMSRLCGVFGKEPSGCDLYVGERVVARASASTTGAAMQRELRLPFLLQLSPEAIPGVVQATLAGDTSVVNCMLCAARLFVTLQCGDPETSKVVIKNMFTGLGIDAAALAVPVGEAGRGAGAASQQQLTNSAAALATLFSTLGSGALVGAVIAATLTGVINVHGLATGDDVVPATIGGPEVGRGNSWWKVIDNKRSDKGLFELQQHKCAGNNLITGIRSVAPWSRHANSYRIIFVQGNGDVTEMCHGNNELMMRSVLQRM